VEIANRSQPKTGPTDLLKLRLAAGEIPRIVRRLRDGRRDIDQALIDIEREPLLSCIVWTMKPL